MTEAFPLAWPLGRKRTAPHIRSWSNFKTSFAKARDECLGEIRRLGGRQSVISTNIPLRRDGLPYADQRQLDDPGVAVYFTRKDKQMCFACDRWAKVEDNMHAVSLTISALRGIERWGTGDMMEAAFTGFTALPAPEQVTAHWRDVLLAHGVKTRTEVEAKYLVARSIAHPDKGGSAHEFQQVERAWEDAQKELP